MKVDDLFSSNMTSSVSTCIYVDIRMISKFEIQVVTVLGKLLCQYNIMVTVLGKLLCQYNIILIRVHNINRGEYVLSYTPLEGQFFHGFRLLRRYW